MRIEQLQHATTKFGYFIGMTKIDDDKYAVYTNDKRLRDVIAHVCGTNGRLVKIDGMYEGKDVLIRAYKYSIPKAKWVKVMTIFDKIK